MNETDLSQNCSNCQSLLIKILTNFDYTIRITSLLTYSFYFLCVICIKELRVISLIYVHHINFYGLIFSILYCIYIIGKKVDFKNESINSIFCSISEILWASLKYLRSFSILFLLSMT